MQTDTSSPAGATNFEVLPGIAIEYIPDSGTQLRVICSGEARTMTPTLEFLAKCRPAGGY